MASKDPRGRDASPYVLMTTPDGQRRVRSSGRVGSPSGMNRRDADAVARYRDLVNSHTQYTQARMGGLRQQQAAASAGLFGGDSAPDPMNTPRMTAVTNKADEERRALEYLAAVSQQRGGAPRGAAGSAAAPAAVVDESTMTSTPLVADPAAAAPQADPVFDNSQYEALRKQLADVMTGTTTQLNQIGTDLQGSIGRRAADMAGVSAQQDAALRQLIATAQGQVDPSKLQADLVAQGVDPSRLAASTQALQGMLTNQGVLQQTLGQRLAQVAQQSMGERQQAAEMMRSGALQNAEMRRMELQNGINMREQDAKNAFAQQIADRKAAQAEAEAKLQQQIMLKQMDFDNAVQLEQIKQGMRASGRSGGGGRGGSGGSGGSAPNGKIAVDLGNGQIGYLTADQYIDNQLNREKWSADQAGQLSPQQQVEMEISKALAIEEGKSAAQRGRMESDAAVAYRNLVAGGANPGLILRGDGAGVTPAMLMEAGGVPKELIPLVQQQASNRVQGVRAAQNVASRAKGMFRRQR